VRKAPNRYQTAPGCPQRKRGETPMILELLPAYGRDYTSKKQVQADWLADKDFYIANLGQRSYTTRQELIDQKYQGWINIRYKKQTQVHVIKLKKSGL
jgi:hypothetical protein